MAGKGSILHEYLVDLVRFDVANELRISGYPDLMLSADETMTALLSGQYRHEMKNIPKRYPDVFFLTNSGSVCVEIGDYIPSKWPEFPVIHIGFNGVVTPIRCENKKFARTIYRITKRLVKSEYMKKPKEA